MYSAILLSVVKSKTVNEDMREDLVPLSDKKWGGELKKVNGTLAILGRNR